MLGSEKGAKKTPMPLTKPLQAAQNTPAGKSSSKMSLGSRVAAVFSLSLIAVVAILFIPAGTLRFWQAWAYIAIFFVPLLSCYLYFLKYDPAMLERRLAGKEQVSEQKRLMLWTRLVSFAILVFPGFDFRFGWSRGLLGPQPLWLTVLAQSLVLAGMLSVIWVMNVNRFAGATIAVETGQQVISSGPYRIVRHPMYAAGTVLWLFTPLALGSYISLPAFALVIPFCILRIRNEEKVLGEQLPGYSEYCQRTRYRLIPFIW